MDFEAAALKCLRKMKSARNTSQAWMRNPRQIENADVVCYGNLSVLIIVSKLNNVLLQRKEHSFQDEKFHSQ